MAKPNLMSQDGLGSSSSEPPPYTPHFASNSRTNHHANLGRYQYGAIDQISASRIQATMHTRLVAGHKDRQQSSTHWSLYPMLLLVGLIMGYFIFQCKYAYEVDQLLRRQDLWNSGSAARQEEIAKWKIERQRYEDDRKRHEQERERRLRELSWDGLTQDSACLEYGARQYRATLSHTPLGLAECAKKAIEIHGQQVFPSQCRVDGACGHVVGYWDVDFDEGYCQPHWDRVMDKGCNKGTGKHHYEAKLMDLHSYNNWERLCTSTPIFINGERHDGAQSCINSIWGKYGSWMIDDEGCL